MGARSQFRRHLFVLEKILSGTYPTTGALAREWEVSERTIRRDIEYLRDMHDAPIEYDRDRNGFYATDPLYRLPAISMTEGELVAMTVGEQVLNAYRGSPWQQPVHEAFARIEALLPEKVSVSARLVSERVSVITAPVSTIDEQVWTAVLDAARSERRLEVVYRSAGAGAGEPREIDPYRIVAHDGGWYVIGYSHTHSAVRVFSLARIEAATVGLLRFDPPSGFEVSDYIDPEFGVFNRSEEGVRTIEIRFDAAIAHLVRERRWHPTQRITDREDGSLILQFETNQTDHVLFRVMPFGPEAEILAPSDLRARAADWAARMADRYR